MLVPLYPVILSAWKSGDTWSVFAGNQLRNKGCSWHHSRAHPSICKMAGLGTRHSSARAGHWIPSQKSLSILMGDRILQGFRSVFSLIRGNSGEFTMSLSSWEKAARIHHHWTNYSRSLESILRCFPYMRRH